MIMKITHVCSPFQFTKKSVNKAPTLRQALYWEYKLCWAYKDRKLESRSCDFKTTTLFTVTLWSRISFLSTVPPLS